MSAVTTPPISQTPPAIDQPGSERILHLSDTPPSQGSPAGSYRGFTFKAPAHFINYIISICIVSINIINTILVLNKGKL